MIQKQKEDGSQLPSSLQCAKAPIFWYRISTAVLPSLRMAPHSPFFWTNAKRLPAKSARKTAKQLSVSPEASSPGSSKEEI
ncbi:MAG: hypothetical protein K2N87_08860 [Eubacterium sp.]|nr:hypothetical protein [Eubacterium sp.]